MGNPEYDRFGPWIIEISALDPPPPLFQPHLYREEEPLLDIKIPRRIERRNARPGMNLYDYMVTLYEEDLVILERVGDDVRSERFPYRDIQCLRYGENLLKGSLRLVLTDKVYDLPFNTVSKDIMHRLVALVRQRYAHKTGHMRPDQFGEIMHGDLSFFFTNLLADAQAGKSEFELLAAQPNVPVGAAETGSLRRLVLGVVGKTLLESLHLSDGRELKCISRGQPYRYKWQTVYGIDTCYIPVTKIVDAAWVADVKNAAVMNLNLKTSGDTVSFAFVHDNPAISSYADFLSNILESSADEVALNGSSSQSN